MRRFAPLAAVCLGWLGCSSVPNPTTTHDVSPSPASPLPAVVTPNPPVWFINSAATWVEAADAGVYRGISTIRYETRGRRLVNTAEQPDQLDGAHAAPPWSTAAESPCKYVFWQGSEVFGAAEWLGAARTIAKFPANIDGSFDWFEGAGLVTAHGLFTVNAHTCALDKLDLPNAATAYAASSTQGLILTALGHARLTLDGGKSYRDVSRELPSAARIQRVQDELHITAGTSESFVVDAQGKISAQKLPEDQNPAEPKPDPEDRWPAENYLSSALEAAVNDGLLLPNGEALAANEGLVVRVQLEKGRATEVLRFGYEGERCTPVAVSDRALVLCELGRSVSVIDAGTGRVERSFDVEQDIAWDRFVVADGEALGFVGPCAGRNASPAVDVVTTASPTVISTQRSAAFCVRTSAGTWVEHQLDGTDAADILAWVPSADGEATALVAPTGTFLHDVAPVEVRGRLRIIRLARNAPPINISSYTSDSPKLVSHALHVLPDGSVEGWLSSGHGSAGVMAVKIDPLGHAEQRPLPGRTTNMTTAGRFALARTEDGRYFETTDYGRSFQPIDPPPGRRVDPLAVSSVGAQLGPYLRIGWGGHAKPLPPAEALPVEPMMMPARFPPAVRLGCRFSGPPASGRLPDGQSLGLSKTPMSQMSSGRVVHLGAFFTPWRGLSNALSGNAEFVFMPLFDLTTPIRRVTVPLSKLEGDERISHELRVGFILDEQTVWPVAAQRYSRCTAPLTDAAGLTIPIGGCVEDPSSGVVIDGRVFWVHPDLPVYGPTPIASVEFSTADFTADKSGKTLPRTSNLTKLPTQYLSGGIQRFKLAPGRRGKTPVLVAVETNGRATLAPVDPKLGTLGAEEPLVSLSKLQLGNDPQCAESPDDARVLLVFTNEIGLQARGLPGIRDTEHGGLAILRWSKQRVCLDAIDMQVNDERHEADLAIHVAQGPMRKLVARFDKQNAGKGAFALVTYATEVRQPVVCEGAAP